jgi:predicted nuclease of predicted toxin-antitoxin system
MKFLIDEDLPRSTGALLHRYGHEFVDVREIGLSGFKDWQIAQYAISQSICLVTGDFGFADIRNYPPAQYSGLVILWARGNATAPYILALLEGFLQKHRLVAEVKGKLIIVEQGRIRVRK